MEDDELAPEDQTDEIEITDEGEVDALDGHEDEVSEDLAGAADGDGQASEGRQEGQVRQPTRAERRVETALREAREAKAEAQRVRDELAEARRAPVVPQEAPAQRAERLAMMDPEQRFEYLLAEQGRQTEARLAQAEFRAEDRADKAAFDSLCAGDKRFAPFKVDVEERLAQMRRGGTTAPRETILKYIIGDRAVSKAPAATTRARNAAASNRTAQVARPGSARGDVQQTRSSGGDDRAARAKRLENMEL